MSNSKQQIFDLSPVRLDMKNAEVNYEPCFFCEAEATYYFKDLLSHTPWESKKITFYGKEIPIPRLSSWYGDDHVLRYSGIQMQPQPWSKSLLEIRKRISQKTGLHFSNVLLNLYRDGNDSVSWHSDDEVELGRNPTIASVSFGASRLFQFRYRDCKTLKKRLTLTHGSLLLMGGATQHYWEHQLPKTAKKTGQRINLTFRTIL